ncbi:hypothetical protein VTK73DRAFT_8328 [Phialemonium thermophilum]|uniref:DASH complex subunit ASK1 n=1 Tax=Phialemonium thermophilum TaxID=223376 RepID=A0ABR3Y7G8_9PEZI
MSRAGSSAERNLTLTEELEKLEQSITLTLQEIDHNFSKAHRIVTSSILPLIEQYGEHSRAVWEASKFWKQFFEASANVSLSGYEELANDGDTTATGDDATVQDTTGASTLDAGANYTPQRRSQGHDTSVSDSQIAGHSPQGQRGETGGKNDESSLLSDGDGTLTGSTPRPPATKSLSIRPQFADLGSPYEVLKREMRKEMDSGGTAGGAADESDTEILFQQQTARLPDMSMTPRQSLTPGAGRDQDGDDTTQFGTSRKHKDPLLHRVLDKNYRLLATPLKGAGTGVSPIRWRVAEKKDGDTRAGSKGHEKANMPVWQDSPLSSPEMEVPKLRSAAFLSPVKGSDGNRYRDRLAAARAATAAPTPGVSVQTPATGRKTRDVFQRTPARTTGRETDEITWESDSDEDIYAGLSPPKTINFALPPSKLLQTPAREASKRIVDDILLTAGAELNESAEYSPSVVKMNANILDDTF